MPEQLLGRIIKSCSNEGELVLDPFAGSGTTLAVAKKLDRRWLGFELSEDYADRIDSRLALIEPGQPLEGGEEPKVSGTIRRRAGGRVAESPLSGGSRGSLCRVRRVRDDLGDHPSES